MKKGRKGKREEERESEEKDQRGGNERRTGRKGENVCEKEGKATKKKIEENKREMSSRRGPSSNAKQPKSAA